MTGISVRDLRVSFDGTEVLHGVDIDVEAGSVTALLGPSGCGKTTLLRTIAGLELPDVGEVAIGGRTVTGGGGAPVPPERRSIGMVFQDWALFPHLTVGGNVAFGLPRGERKGGRVDAALEMVGLGGFADRSPGTLSGGQQQRVALARALAPQPSALLLDEPFSNLDIDTRQRLAGELRALLKSTGTTVLMVTHDQSEAFAMADHIGVMAEGRILQWGDAEALYARPADRFVAGFIGRGGWIGGDALGLDAASEILLRPDQLQVAEDGGIRAVVQALSFRGPNHVAVLRFAGGELLEIDLPPGLAVRIGETLRLRLATERLLAFPR